MGSKWRSTTSLNTSFEDKDTNNRDYDINTEGWSQGFSYPIWPRWSFGLSYAFSQTRYSDITENIIINNTEPVPPKRNLDPVGMISLVF